jgi:uncharacterized protein (DUF488 family)
MKTIWTIGHSTRSIEEFIGMLKSFDIQLLADIRNFPGSRRYPHFNKENLEKSLHENGIRYEHLKALGGRRAPRADSRNTGWRVAAFRGYADYMETPEFNEALLKLEDLGMQYRVAYMCSEAVWWSCHRSLVSDLLKAKGWTVMHIMNTGKADEHPFTKAARIDEGRLTYTDE